MSPAIFAVVLHINLRKNIFREFDKTISPKKINVINIIRFDSVNNNFSNRLKFESKLLDWFGDEINVIKGISEPIENISNNPFNIIVIIINFISSFLLLFKTLYKLLSKKIVLSLFLILNIINYWI